MFPISNGNKGIGIIEMLLVIAILGITLTVLLGMTSFALGVQGLAEQTTRAKDFAQEGMEAVRNIRDNGGFVELVNGTYGLAESSGFWSFSGASDVLDGFTRMASISDVYRDGFHNIVETGGAVDPDTKKVTVIVTWQRAGISHEVALATYLTNWHR